MDIKTLLSNIAPTLLSATLGPMGAPALALLGTVLGTSPTVAKINEVIKSGQMTPEQLSQIKELELKYKADEAERGFKYSELEFKDRDSARKANVEGGTQTKLFWLSLLLLSMSFGAEIRVLFWGYPKEVVDALLVGRILGLFDATAMQVLAYWYGKNSGSDRSKELLAQSAPAPR